MAWARRGVAIGVEPVRDFRIKCQAEKCEAMSHGYRTSESLATVQADAKQSLYQCQCRRDCCPIENEERRVTVRPLGPSKHIQDGRPEEAPSAARRGVKMETI